VSESLRAGDPGGHEVAEGQGPGTGGSERQC
jgi:hypothetical protein